MTNADLNVPAGARKSDPQTSHQAAERVTKSGRAASQRQMVLAALIDNPGATAAEIAALAGMERHDPSRRLPELRKAGLVANGRERVCRIRKALSLTWWPTTAASATPATISPEMIEAIHRAFDYRPPTGEQILMNIARARAQMRQPFASLNLDPKPKGRKR